MSKKRQVIEKIWAATEMADKSAPPFPIEEGWNETYSQVGGGKPRRTTFNYMFNMLTDVLQHVSQSGIAVWAISESYFAGAHAKDPTTFDIYRNLTGENGEVEPSKDAVNWVSEDFEKPGVLKPFMGQGDLAGYLYCDGREILRDDYPRLYSAIGDTWGAGDGATTFCLPDLRSEKGVLGGDGSLAVAGRANGENRSHSHSVYSHNHSLNNHSHYMRHNHSMSHTHGFYNVIFSEDWSSRSGGFGQGVTRRYISSVGSGAGGTVIGSNKTDYDNRFVYTIDSTTHGSSSSSTGYSQSYTNGPSTSNTGSSSTSTYSSGGAENIAAYTAVRYFIKF